MLTSARSIPENKSKFFARVFAFRLISLSLSARVQRSTDTLKKYLSSTSFHWHSTGCEGRMASYIQLDDCFKNNVCSVSQKLGVVHRISLLDTVFTAGMSSAGQKRHAVRFFSLKNVLQFQIRVVGRRNDVEKYLQPRKGRLSSKRARICHNLVQQSKKTLDSVTKPAAIRTTFARR